VVRALKSGKKGESVACCISLAKVSIQNQDPQFDCVLAYETKGSNLDAVKTNALKGIKEMIERRNAVVDENWGDSGFKTVSSSLKIDKEFGCSVSFVVMDPFTFKTTS
ncbi:MAG: hypothetical protein KGD64_15190, partial [Candidatus Heimdallarchaeota archaeon]|nr:hypothetical protein [Candidatus Heimdallarchaeota archaeon]